MLLIGDYTCVPRGEILNELSRKYNTTIFNFSSFVEGFPRLNNLLPTKIDVSTEESFDMSYFNYIMRNDFAFMDMMYVVNEIFKGNNVYLIINHSDFYDKLIESFVEVLKQRYGLVAYFIEDAEDYMSVNQLDDQTQFTVPGLACVDADRVRFVALLQSYNLIQNTGWEE